MIWLGWNRASGGCLSEIIAVKVFKHQLYERTPHLEHVPPVEAMIPLVITNSFKLQRTMQKNNDSNGRLIFSFFFFFSKKGLLLKKSTGVLLLSHCSPLLLISYAKGNLGFNFFPFYPHFEVCVPKGQVCNKYKTSNCQANALPSSKNLFHVKYDTNYELRE